VKDPACRVAPERGGPSRKRRPSPSSGTATKTPAHPRRPKISRISLKEYRRAAAEQERHPCTARRQPDALRPDLWASGRPARREARAPAGQPKDSAPSRSAQRGKECDLRKSRSFSAGRPARICASDGHRQAETPKMARWSEPAQTGSRNTARCGLARRCSTPIRNRATAPIG
jgi:hypothetical protein